MNRKILFSLIVVVIIFCFLIYKNSTMPKINNFEVKEFQTEKEEILIGVISDTHISPDGKKTLPQETKDALENVDIIIHAGDIEGFETLKELEEIAPVFAVKGNNDIRGIKKELAGAISLKIYDFKVGVIHNSTSYWLASHLDWINYFAEKLAKKKKFDVFIFGHTHRSFLKEINFKEKKILIMNPGSPTIPFPFLFKKSIGILRITKDSFEGEIIYLE